MKLTPVDLTSKSFAKKMFGIDESEVTQFLQAAAAQMEEVIRERNSLREILREKEIALSDLKERDKALKDTINTASQMAERMRQDTDRECKIIIADAQQKAEIMTKDAKDSLRKTYQEVADLRRIRMQFESNLKALVQAHLSLIDQGEKYIPPINYGPVPTETI